MHPSFPVLKSFSARSQTLGAQAALQEKSAQAVSQMEKNLSASFGSSVRTRLQAELASLAKEGDPRLFNAGLLNLARGLKAEREDAAAALVLTSLSAPGVPEDIRGEAKAELDAILGIGSAGLRAEHLLGRFAADSTAHPMILAMLAGSVAGKIAGTSVLARLSGSPASNFLTRGLAARFLAGTASYLAEVPVFTLAGRALAGKTDAPLTADLARAGLTLSALKIFGFAGNQMLGRVPNLGKATFTRSILPQATTLFGLLAAHRAEVHLGLRPHVDGDTTVTDALAALLSLGVGAQLGSQILGPGFARYQEELGVRINSRGENTRSLPENFLPATLVLSKVAPIRPIRPLPKSGIAMMVGSGREGPSSSPVENVDLPGLRERLKAANEEPKAMLNRITELMRVAFNSLSPVVQRDAGLTLFKDRYFRRWQEILIEEVRPELEKLTDLHDEYLVKLSGNCMDALEAMIDRGDHVTASKLIGPLAYMVYRPKDRPPQKRFEEILISHPHPYFRLAAMIHSYPGMEMPYLRLMMWRQFERMVIFEDLNSLNPNRKSFAKAVLNFLKQAESDYGRHGSFIGPILEAMGDSAKLSRLKEKFVPETAVRKEAVREQITGYFSSALLSLPAETRALYLHAVGEEIMAKVQSMSLFELREIFLEENFSTVVNGAPIKIMPPILSRQIRNMVYSGQMRVTDAKVLITNLPKSVAYLNSLFFSMGYIPKDYLHFVDPFAN